MKKIILFGLASVLALTVTVGCKKKKDGGNDRCGESEIKVITIPANGTIDPPAPGTSFPLVVNIEAMPGTGASITVTARTEGGSSTTYFTTTLENALSSNNFTITNTPAGTSCVVDVTVTSKTCNTNQWKGSYRYSAK
ncbi:hypothetical protein [Longitalea luteola]|uniref:hypothetical protein n=1 Tax=Longitalea luteola TaxID=2812563 RepID=UPI001A964C41|nr:hypothetical protein [Longitalea luteola]